MPDERYDWLDALVRAIEPIAEEKRQKRMSAEAIRAHLPKFIHNLANYVGVQVPTDLSEAHLDAFMTRLHVYPEFGEAIDRVMMHQLDAVNTEMECLRLELMLEEGGRHGG